MDDFSGQDMQQDQSAFGRVAMLFLELIKIVILAAIVIVLVRYFLFKPFYVKGQSMEPNFYEHEYLIVDELTYRFRDPERGEVVVFRSPTQDKDFYLKRVVGLPGERIKVEDGKVILYSEQEPLGTVLDEEYITEITPGSVTYTVGPDQYFLLGDNRDASLDSRRFGPIDSDALVGRAFFRGWPFEQFGFISTPEVSL